MKKDYFKASSPLLPEELLFIGELYILVVHVNTDQTKIGLFSSISN